MGSLGLQQPQADMEESVQLPPDVYQYFGHSRCLDPTNRPLFSGSVHAAAMRDTRRTNTQKPEA